MDTNLSSENNHELHRICRNCHHWMAKPKPHDAWGQCKNPANKVKIVGATDMDIHYPGTFGCVFFEIKRVVSNIVYWNITIEEVTNYLLQLLEQPFPGQFQVAKHFAVSKTTLQTRFREYHGLPMHEWFAVQKMNRAKEYLTTNAPINQIAKNLSYENTSNFSATFKRLNKKTPGQWRRDLSRG